MRFIFPTILVTVLMGTVAGKAQAKQQPQPEGASPAEVSFFKDIRPILQRECTGCHQPAKDKGGYVMTRFESFIKGGKSGDPAVVPGHPEQSLLLELITPLDGEAEMPPERAPLHESEIAMVRRWIEAGAVDDSPAGTRVSYSPDNPPVYFGVPTLTSMDISPDGALVAAAGFHEVLIFDSRNGELRSRLIGLSERIQSIQYSPDGNLLAVAGGNPGQNGEIQIWDVAGAKLELSASFTFDTLYGISWSPDGSKVAFGASDKAVRAIDVRSGELVLYQGSHEDWVLDTTFSNDGTYVISVGRDMTAKLTELSTQRFIDNITSITPGALKGGIHSVETHPSGEYILFGGADGAPKIYRFIRQTKREIGDDANQLLVLPAMQGRIFDVAFNKDGSRVAAVSSFHGHGYLSIYQISSSLEPDENIRAILTRPTHKRSGEDNKALENYFNDKAQRIHTMDFPDNPLYSAVFTPDGQSALIGGKDGIIYRVSAESGEIESQFPVAPEISASRLIAGEAEQPSKTPSDSRQWILPHERPAELGFRTIPKEESIEAIEVQPSAIGIDEPGAYAQVVVTARTSSGNHWDVSRMARYELENDIADITRSGFITPNADGSTRLSVSVGDYSVSVPVSISGQAADFQPDWSLHVNPVISRLGCNAGTCHGAKDGKNGFKLSLRGYDPVMDKTSLTDDMASRRVNFAYPTRSLMLLKSSSEIPHEGGQLVNREHDYYRILEKWILEGGNVEKSPSGRVERISVHPVNPVVQREDFLQQMRVIAHYPDGRERDVTREAFLESGNTEVAETMSGWPGLVRALRRGEAPVLVRYEGAYASTTLTVMGDRSGFVWEEPAYNNTIDRLVAGKWERMKILPSGLSDDYTFIRRVFLDLTGLPPSQEQVRSFVSSDVPIEEKRNLLIDQLLHSEAFVDHWTNKWADLLQVNAKFLGREGSETFRDWIHQEIASNTPYDQFVSRIITATGSNRENPPASYYKILRDPESLMENTTHLFLATRFNCNKCHDHPFERWTQDQYYEMAAFFARTDLKTDPESGDRKIGGSAVESARPLYEVVYDRPEGEMLHQRTSAIAPPEFPFQAGREPAGKLETRREKLAQWLTSSDNPYFASSYVNRLWGYLMGRGIIEPLDDIRAGNPPSNPQLLDFLTSEFVDSGFNTRHIIRMICQSRTYQLSIETNPWNEDDEINFSHAMARRLPAEVLYDAIHTVLDSTPKIPGVAPGTRAAELPDSTVRLDDGFLGNFGRPSRESSCECERSSDLQLGPVMALISGPTVGRAISDPQNILPKLIGEHPSPESWINAIFQRVLNRPASEEEIRATIQVLSAQKDQHAGLVAQLNDYEEKTRAHRMALEEHRQEKIAAAEKELEEFRNSWEMEKARLTRERESQATALRDSIDSIKAEIRSNLSDRTANLAGTTRWHAADVLGVHSSDGAILQRLPDGSFLASGANGKTTYEIILDGRNLESLTGFRLDTLAHESLPKNGPGRAGGDGNFVLTEFEAEVLMPVISDSDTHPSTVRTWETVKGGASGWAAAGTASWKQLENGNHVLSSQGVDPMLITHVDGGTGWYRVECLMEVPDGQPLNTQLFFSQGKPEAFSEDMSRRLILDPAAGPIQNASWIFHTTEDLRSLRIDPHNAAGDITIYQISLTRLGTMNAQPVKFSSAVADFSQGNFEIAKAVNGDTTDGDGWAVSPQIGRNHSALFIGEKPFGQPSALLRIRLVQNYRSNNHSIGRFSIQTTNSEDASQFGIPAEIGAIIALAPARRTELQTDRLVDFIAGLDEDIADLSGKLEEAMKPVADDPNLARLSSALDAARQPVPPDPVLEQLKRDVALSMSQLETPELTVAQDLAWALINSPAFLFNH